MSTKSEYAKKYRLKNRERLNAIAKKCYWKNIDKSRARFHENHRRFYKKRIDSWAEYLPAEANCEICDMKLYLSGHPRSETICFDHRIENCAIKKPPATFIRSRLRTKESQAIWDSCQFGILCVRCNITLPTNNRKKWLERATAYANR